MSLLSKASMIAGMFIRLDPYLGLNFLVEIEGIVVGGFSEVSGLTVETEVQEYREGGMNAFVHKLAGPTRYPSNLVLKHGITDLETLWWWHQDVVAGTVERKNGTIYLLDARGLPAMWWNFQGAYPVKWQGPDLRADGNSVAVESVELAHKGIEKPITSSMMSMARLAAALAKNVT